jgi:hypothetical protein
MVYGLHIHIGNRMLKPPIIVLSGMGRGLGEMERAI